MKPLAVALLLAAIASPMAAQQVVDSPRAKALDSARASAVPEIQFDSMPDFFKLPEGMNFGEVSGVAVNSKGNVFVFTRSNSAGGPAYAPAAAQLLEFGPTGKFVREDRQGPLRAGRSRTRSASTRTTTSGPSTKARTWSSSSTRPAA